jgi:hypothetical protein
MSARFKIYTAPLTEAGMALEMARVLPMRNNFGIINFAELLSEVEAFGVATRGQLRKLLLKHRKELLRIDRDPIDEIHVRIYSEQYGRERVVDLLRRQLWFSWEGLMRIALELEFGEAYAEFARIRDESN